MDLNYSAEEQAFRKEVRTWLDANIPEDLRRKVLDYEELSKDDLVRWHKILAKKGWVAPSWPVEWGGTGWNAVQRYIFEEEYAQAGAPPIAAFGVTMCGNVLIRFGTDAQKKDFLPRMATGELRGSFSMSEPGCGSDVAAIQSKAVRDGDEYVLNGQKMWLTNGGSSTLCAVLVRTDAEADENASVYKKMSTFLIEKPAGFGEVLPGLTIPGKIEKMGYKGVDTTELVMSDFRLPADALLGGEAGKGFYQMMDGVEVGRVNVAARACGLATRAFELGVDYSQQRVTFGKPIAEHQAVAFRLAEMATKVEAAHLMMVRAARTKDSGARNDLEAGMAKYLASEYCKEVVEDSFRIHGGYGYSKEYEIERLYREAPMLLIGEGTADIQRMIIARRLLEDYKSR